MRKTHPTPNHQVISLSSRITVPTPLRLIHLNSISANFILAVYANCAYNKDVDYQWDRDKAITNLKKHGIDFADAVAVFEDPLALTIEDPNVSEESRWLTLGMDFFARLLVVIYTYRGEAIRLISARKATKKERDCYEGKRKGI